MRLAHMLAGFAATIAAFAASTASAQAPVTTQPVRVWITRAAFADIGEAEMRRRVALLVGDVDAVFAQQTRRRFSFDPATDVTVMPDSSSAPTCFIDARDPSIQLTIFDDTRFGGVYSTAPRRFGLGGCISMTGVQHLHDPLDLPSDAERYDYLAIQLRGLVHEFEHTYGAGAGEYYELLTVQDTTGVPPRIDADWFESWPDQPTDPYWSRHLEYSGDPLTTPQYANPRVGSPRTREDVIAATRFTRGTLAWIDTDWPGMKPSLDPTSPILAARNAVRVKLVDRVTGGPITTRGGSVQVFRFTASLFGTASPFLLRGFSYDPATPWTFAWGGTFGGFAFGESRVLVKASVPGYMPDGTWFTIFDVFDQIVLDGRSTVEITVPMSPVDAPLPAAALVAPAAGSTVENGGDTTLTFDLTASQGLRRFTLQYPEGGEACGRWFAPDTPTARIDCPVILFGTTGGSAGLIATVVDQSGRTSTPARVDFTLVDTRGPQLRLIPSFGPGDVLAPRQPTQAYVEYFDVSGVARWQLTMGRQIVCSATVPVAGDPSFALCAWTTPRIADGTMGSATLTLTAWDRLGHVSSTSGTVTIDALPPTLGIVSPADGDTLQAGTEVTFVLDVADAGGVDSVEIVASGQSLCETTTAPYACTFVVPADWDGAKSFHVIARDVAGNATRAERDLTVVR